MSDERGEGRDERGFAVIDRRGQSDDEGTEEHTGTPGREPQGEPAAGDTQPPLPRVDFSTLVHSFAITALYHMGDAPHPETREPSEKNLPLARQNIDILEVIQEKTRGNLTPEEEQLLQGLLYEVRMRFVEASRSPTP